MKKRKPWLIPFVVIAVFAVIIGGTLFALSQNPVLNMNDVYSTIQTILPYFIPFAIVVVVGIILAMVFDNRDRKTRFLVASQSILAGVLVLAITVNTVCFGPLKSVIGLAFVDAKGLTEETKASSKELSIAIADEGTVLLQNNDQLLPLGADVSKINVFGWASISPVYAGTGSGSVDTATCTDVLKSLNNAGIETNTELTRFYTDYCAVRPGAGRWIPEKTLPEPPASDYSEDLVNGAKEYSEYAMIVLSRIGGEDCDLPKDMSQVEDYHGNAGDFEAGQTYLELSKSEKDMIELVTSNFENVIVLVNSANTMELSWVEDYSQIKSVLWMAGAGQDGFAALGNILKGDVNPSGKLVDVYARDLTQTPSFNNIGGFTYENLQANFVNYVEGIYVGYKFYETYYLGNEEGYQQAVQYPFGYGLSYTSFSQEMGDVGSDAEGNITFDVTVTNTGNVAGKDVVEVYYNPPYTEGGIEKSAVNLVEFAKTDLLEPGASQTLQITFGEEDMASYDTAGEGCYVLEAGDYGISIRTDSHRIIEEKTYTVANQITYGEDNKRSTDGIAAVNQFEDFTAGDVTYLSRANQFANYDQATAAPTNFTISDENLAGYKSNDNYVIEINEEDVMPTTGARNGLELFDLRGLAYDDPLWDTLLDQLQVSDMENLIEVGGYQTAAISSIGKLATLDADGPAAFSSFFNRAIKGTAYPCATMLAATWNKDLAKERGEAMGQEAMDMGISGWYGPAMNIHRSPFSGRNFEYYSEDAVLSGIMAANEVAGAEGKGLYTYIKHFAVNDQETGRGGLVTWVNEQSMREIYLKPFEIAVKEGGATAVMTAVNYIGGVWCGASPELLQTVLRDEWGFVGMVITDFCNPESTFMNTDICIRSGNDMMLSSTGEGVAQLQDTQSATAVTAMRNASHNILYTVVNSNAYEGYEKGLHLDKWMQVAIGIDAAVLLLLLAVEVICIKKYRNKKEEAQVKIEE